MVGDLKSVDVKNMGFFKSNAEAYHRMSDAELEGEASKWKIRGYGYANGHIDRQLIIDALLKKDQANEGRWAIIISSLALIVSIIALLK